MTAPRQRRLCNLGFVLAAIACAVGLTGTAEASPWPREPGRLFIATRTDYFVATTPDPAPGEPGSRFERQDARAYFEYGLGDGYTVGGKAAYGAVWHFDGVAEGAATGVSEAEAFVQKQLIGDARGAGGFRLSGAASSRFESWPRPDMARDGFDLELRAVYGRNLSLRPLKIFVATEAGYRKRFGDGADQVRADALVGIEPSGRLLFLAEILTTISAGPVDDPARPDYHVVKFQPSIVWRARPRWALHAGAMRELWGRNLTRGDAYFIGLWASF